MDQSVDPRRAFTDLADQQNRNFRASPNVASGLVLTVDLLAVATSAILAFVITGNFNIVTLEYYLSAVIFISFLIVALFNRAELYSLDAIMRPVGRSDALIIGVLTAFLFFLTVAFSFKVSEIYSRVWMYTFAGLTLTTLVAYRLCAYRALKALARKHFIGRALVVLGVGDQARHFVSRIDRAKPHFTEFRGVYSLSAEDQDTDVSGHAVLGSIDDLIAAARRGDIDDVVVAMPWNNDRAVTQTVEALKELPINVYIGSDLAGFHLEFRPDFGTFHELPMFEVVQRPISGWSQLLKFMEDLTISAVALLLLSPLLLLVALAIKLDSRGPVFFMQKRLGFNNKEFAIYKFRSMYQQGDVPKKTVQATRDDPRITRVGRFIRRTSIDELPQLLNVLNGTMSLVGPRPHALDHNEEFARSVRGYFARHKVKPGITGWAQVNGFRGETDMAERTKFDLWYIENWSLLLDVKIIVRTIWQNLFGNDSQLFRE